MVVVAVVVVVVFVLAAVVAVFVVNSMVSEVAWTAGGVVPVRVAKSHVPAYAAPASSARDRAEPRRGVEMRAWLFVVVVVVVVVVMVTVVALRGDARVAVGDSGGVSAAPLCAGASVGRGARVCAGVVRGLGAPLCVGESRVCVVRACGQARVQAYHAEQARPCVSGSRARVWRGGVRARVTLSVGVRVGRGRVSGSRARVWRGGVRARVTLCVGHGFGVGVCRGACACVARGCQSPCGPACRGTGWRGVWGARVVPRARVWQGAGGY